MPFSAYLPVASHPFTKPRVQSSVALVVAALLWWWLRSGLAATILGIAVVLATLAWCAPRAHAPVQRVLDAAARGVAVGFSWILLAVTYVAIFVPLHLWRALLGRDPLGLRRDLRSESHLRPIPPPRPGRFGRMY